ncbi:aminopeptidase YwaD [Planifilum fimeticola]|jgi:aminopeptidase YwaD|uniref:Aminopeptidase YwaD n=1 Tax=Planifilum fimeticola TaxID=201975 RepID=A0A2T0LC90_9BACL|nr:M28 family peptidase [Planifilum fimeticola]PRX39618.1 aminopeptidase YwaD [Planifilum fimeticola]
MFRCFRRMGSLALIALLAFASTAYAVPSVPVHTQEFTKKISAERIYQHIAKLADRDDARIAGFEGEHRAADYIARELEKYGLNVERQVFPFLAFQDRGSEVQVVEPEPRNLDSQTMTYSPATPEEGLRAELVYAGLGSEEEFAQVDAKGKIALIKRGEYTFYEKTQNAAKSGAVGAIIFNNASGNINGTLGEPTDIPAASLSDAEGESLKALLEQGIKVTVTMKVDTVLKNSYSQNVIGTIPGKKGGPFKERKTIVVGAHYDGVDTPAANDNASGTGTLLELARVLSKKPMYHDVKVIFFGAEEAGLVGSTHYVESLDPREIADIAAMINMDMVGVGDTMGVMTAEEGAVSFVADRAEEYIRAYGHPYRRTVSDRSDHAPFEAAGIPVVFLNYGPDPNYHTDEDTVDKLSKNNLYNMGVLVTTLTHDIANDKNLPERGAAFSAEGLKGEKRFHNPEFANR